ncbi:MAG: transposase [Verrucomicrobia bacterium]|nr:transposase [Verrucomicrobiota bacterium]
MNRSDRREAIFRNDADRELFLLTLGEACQKTVWQVHAYGLMGNHFHLVVDAGSPGYLRAKLELAVQLRRETTMMLKWIAGRLHLGTGASLSNLLSERRR